jgi:DUF1680 family protein
MTKKHAYVLFLAVCLLGRMTEGADLAKDNPTNSHYIGANRAPLQPSPFIKLPIGSIRPEGWLRKQLELEADGFVGHLEEISKWTKFQQSAWANPKGEGRFGWEELPYWLKGFVDLGYVLQDSRIIESSKKWIEAILSSQREDGYFGPRDNAKTPDIWPNMLALSALRSYYEATNDARVIGFMLKYFNWLQSVRADHYLPGSWQQWRGGDNLDSIYWLYNRTGEPWLLDLGRKNHERTADWTGGIPTWHGVNLTQGFREPAEYFQQAKDMKYLNATLRNYDTIMTKYGRVPGGMFGADENAREGYTGPRQGAETCSMVEFMNSDEMLLKITGDSVWADRAEEIAFNSLPASMTSDLKGLHYLTAPNQVSLDRTNKAPMIENDGDMFSYNPHDYRCCQHNVAFGWPYFAEHLWMATPDEGLAAVLYASGVLVAQVGTMGKVRITETTDYPFDDTIELSISLDKPAKFPLKLRVPKWCSAPPAVTLNQKPAALTDAVDGWVVLARVWKSGDKVQIRFPMSISANTWDREKKTVSIRRGPLTYSLKIKERWEKYGGTSKWPAFEVFADSPWNYALLLPNPGSFEVVRNKSPLPSQPFSVENAPLILRAKGKRLPQWKQETNGMIGQIPENAASSEPIEDIELIPMGCARLRITVFPRIDG